MGRPIAAQVLGPDRAPRKILLVGCIHGNECAGLSILSVLAHRPVRTGVQLWLIRELNPEFLRDIVPEGESTARVPDAAQAARLTTDLLTQGIIIRPLASFGLPNCVRISTGTDEDNQRCVEAIHALCGSRAAR